MIKKFEEFINEDISLKDALETLDPIFKKTLIRWSNENNAPYKVENGKLYVFSEEDSKKMQGIIHTKPTDNGRSWEFEIPDKYMK